MKRYLIETCISLCQQKVVFIVRDCLARFDDKIHGAIICGTSGGSVLTPSAIIIARTIAYIKGGEYKSRLIDKLAFGKYNSSYTDVKTDFDWLSRDEEEVKKYIADPYCGRMFSANSFANLFSLLNRVTKTKYIDKISKNGFVVHLHSIETRMGKKVLCRIFPIGTNAVWRSLIFSHDDS